MRKLTHRSINLRCSVVNLLKGKRIMRNHKGLYVLAILFAMGLLAAGANAATCTPVTINRNVSDAQHDTGTGPNIAFYIRGNTFGTESYWNGTTFNTPSGTNTLYVGPNQESGYVAVFSQFGGCTDSWNYEITHSIALIDVTNGGWTEVWHTADESSTNFPCGVVAYCALNVKN